MALKSKPSGNPTSTHTHTLTYPFCRSGWPPAALIVPGNRLSFDFQSASDYREKKDSKHRWGFRCVVKGYADAQHLPATASAELGQRRLWLNLLESQLGSFGAVCAGNLIAGGEATTQITDPAGDFERKHAYVLPVQLLLVFRLILSLPISQSVVQ